MVSHSPKLLTFYENTRILSICTVLKFTNMGVRFTMPNNWWSVFKEKFFDELLDTVPIRSTVKNVMSTSL